MSNSLYFLPAEIAVMTFIGTIAYLLIWRWMPREKENVIRSDSVFYSLFLILITGGASVFMFWLYRYIPPTNLNILSASGLGIYLMLLPLKRLADLLLADRLALRASFLIILFSGYIVFWGAQIASSQAKMPSIQYSGDVSTANITMLIVLVLVIVVLIFGRRLLRRLK